MMDWCGKHCPYCEVEEGLRHADATLCPKETNCLPESSVLRTILKVLLYVPTPPSPMTSMLQLSEEDGRDDKNNEDEDDEGDDDDDDEADIPEASTRVYESFNVLLVSNATPYICVRR